MLKNPESKKKLDEPSKIFLAIEISVLALDLGQFIIVRKP
jgi:hypothetical protein